MENGYFSRGRHKREIKEFKYVDLMFKYLWFEKDDTNGVFTIGRGNTSRIREEQEVVDHETWSTVNLCE